MLQPYLSATQSPEKKAGLDRWRERVGYQEAARITSQAALRGTEMHYVLENYIDGRGYINLSEDGAKARLMAHEIVNNLDLLKEVWGNEVSLAYEDRWAGATDVVGLYDDKPTIIDFKQSNKPKREEFVEDYYYQIAAYSLAHKEQYGPITQGLICICTKDVLYQEFKMNEFKLKEYEDKWLERVIDTMIDKNTLRLMPNFIRVHGEDRKHYWLTPDDLMKELIEEVRF